MVTNPLRHGELTVQGWARAKMEAEYARAYAERDAAAAEAAEWADIERYANEMTRHQAMPPAPTPYDNHVTWLWVYGVAMACAAVVTYLCVVAE